MKYINTFKNHSSYEEKLNVGGVDIILPNISYCEDVKDVHYNPYNTVEFYVGEITGTTPQTVKIIYKSEYTSVDVTVSEGNKWYTYLLPKDKGLYNIEGDSVKKIVVKADISFYGDSMHATFSMIPYSTIEASFKGSNTSNVTSMAHMFAQCNKITSLDVSNFNTSNVTDMNYMFSNCRGLTSLDLRNFNTSKVTNMHGMFELCTSLTSLDLSSFNTSNVTYMSNMFRYCSVLTSLDISGWNTSNVTYMSNMFRYCSVLTSLDLSNFNTSKVTDMRNMFSNCSGLTSLDLSGWDMSNVTLMDQMFKGCSKLKTIRMVGCSGATRTKIQNQLTADGITGFTIVTE